MLVLELCCYMLFSCFFNFCSPFLPPIRIYLGAKFKKKNIRYEKILIFEIKN